MNLGRKIVFWLGVLGLSFSVATNTGCKEETSAKSAVIVRTNLSAGIEESRRIYGTEPNCRLECSLINYDQNRNIVGEIKTEYIWFKSIYNIIFSVILKYGIIKMYMVLNFRIW